MTVSTFLYFYLAGAVLVALHVGWHIRYRLDKYDRMFSDVRGTFWLDVLLWPLFFLKPDNLIHPKFSADLGNEGRAEEEREMDRLVQNLPPCAASIRYAPKHDESGDCDSEFVFDAAEVEAVLAKRLAELSAEKHSRYPTILNWLHQRDPSCTEATDVPAAWNSHFLNVAISMMNRGLGQVRCGKCRAVIPHADISLDSSRVKTPTSGLSFTVWRCPQNHKLLTKDVMHFLFRKAQ